MDYIKRIMDFVDGHKLYPDLRIVEGPVEPEVLADGKKTIMFSSNNYLGLATHPKLKEGAKKAVDEYGVGSDGSRLLSGNLKVHRDLEKRIARFKGGEDAIIWPSGYAANVGVITALMNPLKVGPADFFNRAPIVFSDALNHASIIDGIRMSKAKKVVYPHNDMVTLERFLKKYKSRRKLVVTDSVFSMDGDLAPLDVMAQLCKKYDAMLMIDEAHASGVVGETGHGALEHFGLKAMEDVHIVMGTFSKALAGTGGFVVGSKELIRYLRIASRSYMFSTAMTPAAAASNTAALEVIETEPDWRKSLINNYDRLRDGFHNLGFSTFQSSTQIIPVMIGKDEDAIAFSRMLYDKGYFVPCVRWPAVEKGKARLRVTVMATHTNEQIDGLLDSCSEIKKKLSV